MYAYTIAGVAYDEASGLVNYLVLDPHFAAPANSPTGDLSLIHKKVPAGLLPPILPPHYSLLAAHLSSYLTDYFTTAQIQRTRT